jgi:dTDP-4-dehydrorhamnose 3,5-epimerase
MRMEKPEIIEGGLHADDRGSVAFVNNFDLKDIRRFYTITHPDTNVIRAWQGHKKEAKWFFCSKGSFQVLLVKIDNWESPSNDLKVISFQLSENKPRVVAVPPGYANGFKATEPDSTLVVFSDTDLEASKIDDFRFNRNLWYNWKTI